MNKQFEEWLNKTIPEFEKIGKQNDDTSFEVFQTNPFSMQWGVYLEFFNSINKQIVHRVLFHTTYLIYHQDMELLEAQQEAIKKEFEILMLNELSVKGVQSSKAGKKVRNELIK